MKGIINKRKLGNVYEDKACKYLKESGYKILDRNFRSYKGEIDIIALDSNCLVFFEVKYRSNKSYGYSTEAVGVTKQRVIYRVAEVYITLHKEYEGNPCRFDVIGFDDNKMTHIKNAFGGL